MPQSTETQALVLRLPDGSHPLALPGQAYFLPVIVDHERRPETLSPGVRWMYAGEVIRHICRTRAVAVVDGTLRVAGERRMTPERYIERWRQAIRHSVPIDAAAIHLDLQAVAVFEFDPRAVPLARTDWSNPPGAGLQGLLDAHRDQERDACERQQGSQACRLAVDLTTNRGARDAWWIQDYLRPRDTNRYPLKVSVAFRSAKAFNAGHRLSIFDNPMAATLEPQVPARAA
jgi:hypothetical protein